MDGVDGLLRELDWLSGGMNDTMSDAIHDLTVEAHGKMVNDFMAYDTGFMSGTADYSLGFMSGSVFSITTTYALFNDGEIQILNRPYTTTPFITPTINFILSETKKFDDVVSARSN